MSSKLLVLNAGSSSLKFKLFGTEPFAASLSGMFDRIGDVANCVLKAKAPADTKSESRKWEIKVPAKDHVSAMSSMIDFIKDNVQGGFNVLAVGHRIVHGLDLSDPVLLNETYINKIREASVLAPLHNPPGLQGINAAQTVFPNVPQVAVFDTAFHASMPPHAYMYALPYELYEKNKIRRYGFHGTSHKYLVEQAAAMLNKPVSETNVITCHLGAGSSIAAVRGGKCVDTTMGLTPLEGLIMGTRSGDLDPAIVLHLQKELGLSIKDADNLLNKKSGLVGITGHSDLRTVIDNAQQGEPRSALGMAMVVYRIRKYIGAYTAALEGKVDAVVFSAGIGENSSIIRGILMGPMADMGMKLDSARNDEMVNGKQGDIATADSRVRLLVIPTDEELSIAQQTLQVVKQASAGAA